MHYIALATDYDGTIAEHGVVGEDTIKALEKLRPAARRLILVTGRELAGLAEVMPQLNLFDVVVAENEHCSTGRIRGTKRRSSHRPLRPLSRG